MNTGQEQVRTVDILTFLIDLIKNLNKIATTTHEDPKPILNLISKHLVKTYFDKLSPMLTIQEEIHPERPVH